MTGSPTNELLRELYDEGLNDAQIAARAVTDKDRVRRWRQANKLPSNYLRSGEQIESDYIASISDDDKWPLPVRPLQVNVPVLEFDAPERAEYTSIHYGDVHFPHHSESALAILYAITKELQPNLIVCHGDLVDATKLSQKFEQDPQNTTTFQDELKDAGRHLGIMASLAPDSERWYILGNHEDRLRRLVWNLCKTLPEHQLFQLPTIREALRWESLLGLGDSGFELIEGKRVLFDKLVLKHGDMVRQQSAYTARGELEKYQKSGISGHTHRRGVFEKRDLNGFHAWFEHGCLCDLDPAYVTDPNWQQGFVVVTWSADRSHFGVEEVRIHDGVAMFRGRLFGT